MTSHDDFAVEPVPGLPERPPHGEDVLWQGRPDSFALARDAYKITWVAGYFVLLAAWRAAVISDGSPGSVVAVILPYLLLGLIASAILYGMAWVAARTTVYTITTSRVAMRIGAALTVTLNLPFTQIGAAHLDLKRNGTGTIALETLGDTRISYLVCWPHVRPWHFARTQPSLRCIPDAERVASLLAQAAETRLNLPVIRHGQPGMAVAAE
ncbi:PH domain-containing protein [Tabrizicola sp. J26]|uniref:photosynthetic complex putative assembly protein PuhB n=1 Tax=Alitabrizicola rongguiensis TaxID=2909234 RepID=UPI001F271920|nr:photosynthetic complex putative assembly protein PuhB [Tabrizicola rongguiensis]MCF1710687.1 PH domain-containing protein [Tabrizicola rongguiensis]